MDNDMFFQRASTFINSYDQLEAEGVMLMNSIIDDEDGINRFVDMLSTLSSMKDAALETGNKSLAETCLFMTVGVGHCLNKVLVEQMEMKKDEEDFIDE